MRDKDRYRKTIEVGGGHRVSMDLTPQIVMAKHGPILSDGTEMPLPDPSVQRFEQRQRDARKRKCYLDGCENHIRMPDYSTAFITIVCPAHWKECVEADPDRCETCGQILCENPAHATELDWVYTGGADPSAILIGTLGIVSGLSVTAWAILKWVGLL